MSTMSGSRVYVYSYVWLCNCSSYLQNMQNILMKFIIVVFTTICPASLYPNLYKTQIKFY